jgi:hypothetical protein
MATWKKLVVSGSDISQLNNDAGYITSVTAQHAFVTASINGVDLLADSSQGTFNIVTGSAGTGLTITGTAGTDTISFDLSAIPNSTLENSTISGVSLGSDLNNLTVDDSTIALNSGTTYNGSAARTISVKDGGITFAKLAGASVVDSVEGISNATTGSDDNIATTKAIKDYVDATAGAATLNIESGNDSSTIAIDLDSETLTVTGNDGLTVNNAGNDVGIGIDNGGINAVKLNSDVAGSGLTSTSGVLSLTDDSITFGSDTVSLGDTVTQLSLTGFTGSFVGDIQGTASVASKTAGTLVDGNGIADFSFDGSGAASVAVELDGGTLSVGASGLKVADGGITGTQLATSVAGDGLAGGGGSALSVNVDDSTIEIATDTLQVKNSGITNAKLANAGFDIAAGTNGTGTTNEVSLGDTLTINGSNNEVDIVIGTDSITVGLPQDVTIGQDLTVSRNLTVIGTASFQHTEDLDVADRFIRLASGSNSAGDGGIVIQQTGVLDGEAFGFDSAQTRWGVSGSFDASQNSFAPDAFMAAVLGTEISGNDPNGAQDPGTRYNKKGNIYVANDSQDIWIYS